MKEKEDVILMHNLAMELYDLARIHKAKGNPILYKDYMRVAYMLDKEAAINIQVYKEEDIRRANYPRSAGWLAFFNQKYVEANQFVELGLTNEKTAPEIEIEKLLELREEVLKKLDVKKSNIQSETLHLLGILYSADVKTHQIKVQFQHPVKNGGKFLKISVPKEKIIEIARLFLGEMVEIRALENEGGVVLMDIKRAA